jgi:hypothetical protein
MRLAMAAICLSGCLTPVPDTGIAGTSDEAEISGWSQECSSADSWHGEATVQGTSNGTVILDFWDTGSLEGWNEEHRLAATGDTTTTAATGSGGSGAGLVTQLFDVQLAHVETQTEVADSAPGTGTTWFGCGEADTFNLGALTYAVRVYDSSSKLADCVVFGQDPATIIAGVYTTTGGLPTHSAELSTCRTASF